MTYTTNRRSPTWRSLVATLGSAACALYITGLSAQPQSIEERDPRLAKQIDLVVRSIGVSDSNYVTYTIRNRGLVDGDDPFVVDIYVNGDRRDTVKHSPLKARGEATIVSNVARFETCQPGEVKIVVDPQQTVREVYNDNNESTRKFTPACPDLVASIGHDWVNNNLQYRIKVTVTNRGDAATSRGFAVLATATGGTAFDLPVKEEKQVGPLGPAQSVSFFPGDKNPVGSKTRVHVVVDRFAVIAESNEANNETRRQIP